MTGAYICAATGAPATVRAPGGDDEEQLARSLTPPVIAEQFVLGFQPVVNAETGAVHRVEALLGRTHEKRGEVFPSAFLPAAQAAGLTTATAAWLIGAACREGRNLRAAGTPLAVSVSLSAPQVSDPRTPDMIAGALDAAGLPANALIIEVGDATMIDESATAQDTLTRLDQLGVQLAVAGFGTGHSNMAYLRRHPVAGLKIDPSFVRRVDRSPADLAVVASLVRLGRALDLWVVADGVETRGQLNALRGVGCQLVQGGVNGPCIPAQNLPDAIRNLNAKRSMTDTGDVGPLTPVEAVLLDRITDLHERGLSIHTIAAALNSEGHRTPAGIRWHARSVAKVLNRSASEPTPPAPRSANTVLARPDSPERKGVATAPVHPSQT